MPPHTRRRGNGRGSCVEAALAAGTSHTQWNGGRLALTTTIDSRAKAERRNCMAGPERCGKSQCRRTIKKLGIAILQHRKVQGQRWANAMVAGERWSRHTLYTPHYTHPPTHHIPSTPHRSRFYVATFLAQCARVPLAGKRSNKELQAKKV